MPVKTCTTQLFPDPFSCPADVFHSVAEVMRELLIFQKVNDSRKKEGPPFSGGKVHAKYWMKKGQTDGKDETINVRLCLLGLENQTRKKEI